jgi:AAA domain, putative AbiEii toxin, Type IV TA system
MYFNSVEFTDFPPFAKGSRMECQPVPDKPDDLAEVHLITGENGTGKTRLLCLLTAALGQTQPLLNRCRNETLLFAVTLRLQTQLPKAPILRISKIDTQISADIDKESSLLAEAAKAIPALSRTGLTFLTSREIQHRESYPETVNQNRLMPTPAPAYSSGFLPRLQQVVVAARLNESPRMVRLVKQLEWVLSDIMGSPFKFSPKTYPLEEMRFTCATLGKEGPVPLAGCPDGLISLIGWIVDCALIMEDFSDRQNWTPGVIEACERDLEKATAQPGLPLTAPSEHMASPKSESAFDIPCIILLDEIETHLHPSWQWKVLPAFQKMFPKAQIFVATHSPFVIASLNKGMIHRLRRGPDGVVDEPRAASEGDSYETALEDIQDVKQRFDPVSEALLDGFYKQRSTALAGDAAATARARELVKEIARRSPELEDIIGRESRQMERQLKELIAK